MHLKTVATGAFALVMFALTGHASAQAASQSSSTPAIVPAPNGAAPTVSLPADYVIGPEDVLSVQFWRDKDMSAEVSVRPDGIITLPLLNEVRAAGLTPDQLREELRKVAAKYVEDPNVTVTVKAINSRRVFITGNVGKVGAYPLATPTTVLQLITMAGGLLEFAKAKEVVILRTEPGGRQQVFKFNYNDVKKGKNLKQNIELKPGDTVIVP